MARAAAAARLREGRAPAGMAGPGPGWPGRRCGSRAATAGPGQASPVPPLKWAGWAGRAEMAGPGRTGWQGWPSPDRLAGRDWRRPMGWPVWMPAGRTGRQAAGRGALEGRRWVHDEAVQVEPGGRQARRTGRARRSATRRRALSARRLAATSWGSGAGAPRVTRRTGRYRPADAGQPGGHWHPPVAARRNRSLTMRSSPEW